MVEEENTTVELRKVHPDIPKLDTEGLYTNISCLIASPKGKYGTPRSEATSPFSDPQSYGTARSLPSLREDEENVYSPVPEFPVDMRQEAQRHGK